MAIKESKSLWAIWIILLVVWALGVATGHTMNGYIHGLLIAALVVAVLGVLKGKSVRQRFEL
jgi:hypothetical protein